MKKLETKKMPDKTLGWQRAAELKAEYKSSYIKMTRLMFDKMRWTAWQANDTQTLSRIRCVQYEGDNICVCTIACKPGGQPVLSLYKILRTGKRAVVITWSKKENTYLYFTDHFFARYGQRFALLDFSIIDLVRHFADNNSDIKYEKVKEKNQHYDIKAASEKGLMACDTRSPDVKTFITVLSQAELNRKQARKFNSIRKAEYCA